MVRRLQENDDETLMPTEKIKKRNHHDCKKNHLKLNNKIIFELR